MVEAVIKAQERKDSGTRANRKLRQQGIIPGVVYGHGQEGLSIAVNGHDFVKALHTRARMFDLKVEGRPDEKVLVKDLQYDTYGDEIIHVDLLRVDLTEMVEVTVPVVLAGHPVGVTLAKGVLDQPLHELRVRCLPLNIPNEFRVSVAHLEIDMMVSVKDLVVPEGVTVLNIPEQVVAMVHPPIAEEELVPATEAAEGPVEPEVIGVKEREEAAAAAEAEAAAGKGEKKPKAEKGEKEA